MLKGPQNNLDKNRGKIEKKPSNKTKKERIFRGKTRQTN